MTTLNEKNINISNIYGLKNNSTLQNININNSIKIPVSAISTNSKSNNINAGILIKDINSTGSGSFYNLNVNSFFTTTASLYFNSNLVIDSTNLLSEIENKLVNYPLETSNIIVGGGYINFSNGTIPNINQGATGVGLRYSNNNTVQFKNYNTNWIDLIDITKHDQFSELVDVDVTSISNPLLNNQYIKYNATTQLFVNSNLSIINDNEPTLGGNLNIGQNLLQFNGTNNISRLVFNSEGTLANIIDNNLLTLKNNTIGTGVSNYLEINNAREDESPSIIAKSMEGHDSNVGIDITTTGTGNINLNAQSSNIYVNADSLVVSGFITNSIYKSSSNIGGYLPGTNTNIPLTNDIILFDFINTSTAGTYWANVNTGINGQKINLIYNNKGTNVINVLVNFGNNGLITNAGYSTGLNFTSTGQSSSLVYLDDINAWQILNTGANSIF